MTNILYRNNFLGILWKSRHGLGRPVPDRDRGPQTRLQDEVVDNKLLVHEGLRVMLDPRARTETQDKIFPFCLELRSDSDSWRFKTASRSSAPPFLLYPNQKVVQDKDNPCPGHVLDMSRTGPKKGQEIKRKGVRRIRISPGSGQVQN